MEHEPRFNDYYGPAYILSESQHVGKVLYDSEFRISPEERK